LPRSRAARHVRGNRAPCAHGERPFRVGRLRDASPLLCDGPRPSRGVRRLCDGALRLVYTWYTTSFGKTSNRQTLGRVSLGEPIVKRWRRLERQRLSCVISS